MTRNAAIERAIAAIPEAAWTPVRYPGAVQDPDTGAWISDAEVAEIAYTAFASTPDRITARLLVRRVKDARYLDALFPVWRYHPFFTNTDLPIEQADITHRQHAIIETVFADLIDGPLAHLPSGRFGANSAWILCAAIAHNLLRAAGVLAGQQHARARGSTLRRRIINVAARLARPQRRPMLHLPTHWPWVEPWLRLWHTTIGYSPPIIAQPVNPARHGPTGEHRKSWADQQPCHTHTINQDQTQPPHPHHLPISGSRLRTAASSRSAARRPRRRRSTPVGPPSRWSRMSCSKNERPAPARARDLATAAGSRYQRLRTGSARRNVGIHSPLTRFVLQPTWSTCKWVHTTMSIV